MKTNLLEKIIIFSISIVLFSSCHSSKQHLKKFADRDSYTENQSVLGLTALNADYNYYSQAVLEYLLVREIIDGNSNITSGKPKYKPKSNDTVTKITLFSNLNDNNNVSNLAQELRKIGVKPCEYDLPLNLKDLGSGFQFNHYIFKNENRAALQAFGIVDNNIKHNSIYVVTDYIQYKDIKCTGLPTIRYAVGIRAQFRIANIDNNTELKGIGSLAGLAADVENKSKIVNITIKTIGITGIDSRLSIPSNTSFDVETYSDYQKIIDFIRTLDDNKNITLIEESSSESSSKNNSKSNKSQKKEVIISPQIIPVMDDYRTSINHTFNPSYEAIQLVETRLNELKNDSNLNDKDLKKLDSVRRKVVKIKLEMIEDEVENLNNNRAMLLLGNKYTSGYDKYNKVLVILKGLKPHESLDEFLLKKNLISKDKESDIKSYYIRVSSHSNLNDAQRKLAELIPKHGNFIILNDSNNYYICSLPIKGYENAKEELDLYKKFNVVGNEASIINSFSFCPNLKKEKTIKLYKCYR
ncbi:hypothetical protein [Tenacibaculum discolor]|uniref:hypothetical protein n=1 Tax=Tenacibaculum discolor TaxID=361581 RepID=UPI000EB17222|nr:hypothetical protein [Tenacibaculum discolor]RLJ97916.1 hypothetical protein C8N27_3018 [Tenacibaculum discolor]